MSLSLTPSKRQHNRDSAELKGKKFQKTSSFDSPKEPTKSTSGADVFRVLCPSSKIESILGKDENIISRIRSETGAIVRIDGPIPGCDERVIFIMGPDKEARNSNEQSNNDNGESKSIEDQVNSDEQKGNDNARNNSNANDIEAEPQALLTDGDAQSGEGTSSVQRALLLVLEKFFEGETKTEVGVEESNDFAAVTFRLLVLSSQVGCLFGKGGPIIKKMSVESGAEIRVLARDELPRCASSADDVVQIVGVGDAVQKAIISVSNQIMENTIVDHDALPSNSSRPAFHLRKHPGSMPELQSTRPLPFRGVQFGGGFRDDADFHPNPQPFFPHLNENIMPSRIGISDIVTFRLLCPDERVGGVIGKGGAIIKTLKHETGCDIKVLEGHSGGEERIVVVSGPAHPKDERSGIQDAILRILNHIGKATPDCKEKGVTAKFLVHSNQIGCLIGKGGSIIAEMRKVTGAFILLGKEQLPNSVSGSDDEEVIQINGSLKAVKEAVLQITTRLQHNFFRDAFPSAFSDRAPPFPYMERWELSPNFSHSFRNFNSIGAPPFHGVRPHDDHPPFMRDVSRPGVSERPWPPQSLIEGDPKGMLDYVGPHNRQMFGFGGESQHAIITNTIFEVIVPSSIIPALCGEDGGCLRQIRQISDAKIVFDDPRPGSRETLIIISGTPEQTHAAQSLIQAFVMIENESSR